MAKNTEFNKVISRIMQETRVKLTEMFNENFRSESFFGKKWQQTKNPRERGTILVKSGRLRRSILQSKVQGTTIIWKSDTPYAKIHNEGGNIKRKNGKITQMPQRQFIGSHPQVDQEVKKIVDKHINEAFNNIFKK